MFHQEGGRRLVRARNKECQRWRFRCPAPQSSKVGEAKVLTKCGPTGLLAPLLSISLSGSAIVNGTKSYTVSDADIQSPNAAVSTLKSGGGGDQELHRQRRGHPVAQGIGSP